MAPLLILQSTTGHDLAAAVAVYLHENKVLTINEYKQKLKYIMQTRSYTKSKLIRLGPYLQIEVIGVQCICIT